MDLSVLETFLTIARLEHMTRAAAELHLTQPAVSAKLAKLEDQLGHKLFDRTPKGMRLTEAGEIFRVHARAILDEFDAGTSALAQLAGMQRGSLAIGGGATATTYLLPPLLGVFHARFPGIQLFVREQGSQSVLEDIARGILDIGVITLPTDPSSAPGPERAVDVEPWVRDELRLIVPNTHPLHGRTHFTWGDLDGASLVLFEAGSAVRDLLDAKMSDAHIKTDTVMELRSIESIKQMVAQGIGAAFVSKFALDANEGGLAAQDGGVTRDLAIVTRSGRAPSRAAAEFLSMMMDTTRSRAPGGR